MKRFYSIVRWILVLIVLLLLVFFSGRNTLLNYILKNKIEAYSKLFKIEIKIDHSKFVGLTTVDLKGVKVSIINGDSLFTAADIRFRPRFLPFFVHKLRFKSFEMDSAVLNLQKSDSIWNIAPLLHRSLATEDSSGEKVSENNYALKVEKLSSRFFDYIPSRISISNFNMNVRIDSVASYIGIRTLVKLKEEFNALIDVHENQIQNLWQINGLLSIHDEKIRVSVVDKYHNPLFLPVIKPLIDATCRFDSAALDAEMSVLHGSYVINMDGWVRNLAISQPRLTNTEVRLGFGRFLMHSITGDNFFEIDSTSNLELNSFSIHPYFRLEQDSSRRITFKILPKEFNAMDFFGSLPSGLFSTVEGLEAEGRMRYHLNFSANYANPDSLLFDSRLECSDFRILNYGAENFSRINGAFVHKVYDKGRYIKSILIGPENPEFTPVTEVPEYLIYSIFAAEDPDFYSNSGFNREAFRRSIATNMKEHRFARGGSTLTMQLVKNVFLTNKKTVQRKAEEALIVWILGKGRIVPKSRILEIYLNIAEWGPGVYGIYEASDFYFNKKPSELNLSECIYLTSIIPRPKSFKYSFDKEGNLRPFLTSYFRIISGLMVSRGQIPAIDTVGLQTTVNLTGPAKEYFLHPDTVTLDSIKVTGDDDEDLIE